MTMPADMSEYRGVHRGQSLEARRDRRLSAREVACPECGAGVGAYCTSADGSGQRVNSHRARRRMALKAGIQPEPRPFDIECPECGATPGRGCTSTKANIFGTKMKNHHKSRLAAAKKEN